MSKTILLTVLFFAETS